MQTLRCEVKRNEKCCQMTKFFTQRMIIFTIFSCLFHFTPTFLRLFYAPFVFFITLLSLFRETENENERGEGRTTIETHHLLIFSSLFVLSKRESFKNFMKRGRNTKVCSQFIRSTNNKCCTMEKDFFMVC